MFCENALANSTLLCFADWILQKKAAFFYSTALLRPARLWLHSSKFALLLTTGFLGQRTVRVKALQLALRTISAALVPPTHAFDSVLGRTASQIELSSHTNCSAKQGLVLDTDF